MSKHSGQNNNQQKTACGIAAHQAFNGLEWRRGAVLSFLMLLALMTFVGHVKASTISAGFSGEVRQKQIPSNDQSYRVAQMRTSMENWQSNAFSAIDMQRRLDALSRDKDDHKTRPRKRRRAVVKKRKIAKPVLPKTIKIKKAAALKSVQSTKSKVETVEFTGIVREPVKLQHCLQKAGYYNGLITGELDDATLYSYLAFRDGKNLKHRPNNLYDPVIQKALFALCPAENGLSKLKLIVASATEKKKVLTKPVQVASKKAVTVQKVTRKKTIILKPMRKIAVSKAPLTTASISTNKKQTRLPGVISRDTLLEKSFASDVLVATDSTADQLRGKKRVAQLSGASSSFPVKRSTQRSMAAKPAAKKKIQASGERMASLAGKSSSAFPKRVSISDLAMVQQVNPNTCSPQKHEPALAMSSSPVMSTRRPLSSVRTARIYDDGPMITGAISSTPRSGLRALKRRARLLQTVQMEKTCLPQDLYDLLAMTHGQNSEISVCKQDCLPAPKTFSKGQKALFGKQYNINWCGAGCLGIADSLPLREVMKIEREASVHVCMAPQTRLTSAVKKGLDRSGINASIRALYERLPGGYGNADNIAVIIGNRNYGRDINVNDAGHVNAAAMKALLVEQLGYKTANVIMVKDATRKDFVRLFGRRGDVRGDLQKRLKANRDARLMVYYSGHASSSGLGMDNYLLPVDAIAGIEDKTAYSLATLYDNLRELDARTTQLFLEAGFNTNRSHMVLAPNIAERRVNVAPIVPVRGLTVFTAATGDQKPLVDHETGIGLFTRYLMSGLAGKADESPIGNDDRNIGSVELYVHLASKVRLAARKTLGLRQNPTLSRTDNLFLSQLSRRSRR